MAAEKLTKGRLIQILFLMAVLITAFVWRTITYEPTQPSDQLENSCQLMAEECTKLNGEGAYNISLSPFPAIANSELFLQVGNTDVKPNAVVEGLSMYMGSIPVVFEKQADGWVGRFTVPECTHAEMEWVIKLNTGSETISGVFTVKK